MLRRSAQRLTGGGSPAWPIALVLSAAVGVAGVAGAAANDRDSTRTRSAAASSGPDLVVRSGSVRRSSGRLRGSVTVRNKGRRRAKATTGAVGIRLEGSGQAREAGRFKVTALRAGRSDDVRVSIRIPAGLPLGRHRVVVCADVRRQVRERSETNNCRTFGSLTVVAPAMPAPVPPPPPAVPPPPPAPVPPPPPAPPDTVDTPAAFPSVLRASARDIVDENNHVLPRLKGFNMHVEPGFTWDQSHFDAITALGGTINRAVIHWDDFEPTQGAVSAAAIANLDLHIARAQAAGMYTLLDLHLNVGRSPAWADPAPEMEQYATYGQVLTQYLADRYGDPTSSSYTKAVIGFGLNEPPLEDAAIRNGTGSIPYLEGKQRQMISWLRAPGFAPSWIGFVAVGYAGATPIYGPLGPQPRPVDASPTAYDGVGANVVYDVHDYMMGCEVASPDPANHTLSDDPNCDGRQANGMLHPTGAQGGPLVGTDSPDHSYVSTPATRGQLTAFMKPYKTFTTQASIPLMLGEWGWGSGTVGEQPWIVDQKAVWADAGTAIEIHWNYDVSPTATWAARPGGTWRPSVATWMAPQEPDLDG
jgi:hypothetical protein